ncbi:MAG: type III secretion protein [Desulfovibrionaceae bacterium]|nr:type III secretion protein [Desulfovibrionaceae bacterium]
MPSPLTNLNPNIGIQSVLTPQDEAHIPESKSLPTTTLSETGLNELFALTTTDKMLEQTLCPKVGDGTILKPTVFSDCLKDALDVLKDSPLPAVKTFVRDELTPLLENENLLKAYSGLLIGG